jgi:hypothetical protein
VFIFCFCLNIHEKYISGAVVKFSDNVAELEKKVQRILLRLRNEVRQDQFRYSIFTQADLMTNSGISNTNLEQN